MNTTIIFCVMCGGPGNQVGRFCARCGRPAEMAVAAGVGSSAPIFSPLPSPPPLPVIQTTPPLLPARAAVDVSPASGVPLPVFLFNNHRAGYILLVFIAACLACASVIFSAGQLLANGIAAGASTVGGETRSLYEFGRNFLQNIALAVVSYTLQFVAVPFFVVSAYLRQTLGESRDMFARRFMQHQFRVIGLWGCWVGYQLYLEWAGYVSVLTRKAH